VQVAAEAERSDGFAQFMTARERSLQRTAWLLTGDRALAEDLVQTALAQTWRHWDRIRRRDDPELYVRRIMVNTWSSWYRRKWRGERPSELVVDQPTCSDVATEVAMRIAVKHALGSLNDRQRAVVVLRLFDDLSEAQVASVLECPIGTVKSLMSRALAKLRADPGLAELAEVAR
jgi:RNA polymerase sigma-70 factor (sigma-E family)